MGDTGMIAIFSMVGTILGSLLGAISSSKMTKFRLEALESQLLSIKESIKNLPVMEKELLVAADNIKLLFSDLDEQKSATARISLSENEILYAKNRMDNIEAELKIRTNATDRILLTEKDVQRAEEQLVHLKTDFSRIEKSLTEYAGSMDKLCSCNDVGNTKDR